MKLTRWAAVSLVALMFMALALACGQLNLGPVAQETWTPAPVSAATLGPGAVDDVLTVMPAATDSAPVATPSPLLPEPSPIAAPTLDPHRVVISEADIASSIANGAGADSGTQVDGLAVRFTGGKTYTTARQVVYGPVSLQNLAITGRLVARDGALQLDTESVEPSGFVSAMIPGMLNQALKSYTARWYVEDVQTEEGQVVLRIR